MMTVAQTITAYCISIVQHFKQKKWRKGFFQIRKFSAVLSVILKVSFTILAELKGINMAINLLILMKLQKDEHAIIYYHI